MVPAFDLATARLLSSHVIVGDRAKPRKL